jgi:hypothetical protein
VWASSIYRFCCAIQLQLGAVDDSRLAARALPNRVIFIPATILKSRYSSEVAIFFKEGSFENLCIEYHL